LVETWAQGKAVSDLFTEWGSDVKEFVAGAKAKTDPETYGNKKDMARRMFDMNMKMFLRDNFVHGDLHGGNLLVDTENKMFTVLDAGLTATLKKDIKPAFARFIQHIFNGDAEGVSECLLEFDEKKGNVHTTKRQDFFNDIGKAMGKFVQPGACTTPEGETIVLGDVIGAICYSLNKFEINLRGDIAAMLSTMSVAEGLILSLDPEFDVIRNSLPYLVRFSGWENRS
jgi:predicted unusual protein kinase regulating ubiquinone biosynthesis (AarF/ABC1/UbiB family)